MPRFTLLDTRADLDSPNFDWNSRHAGLATLVPVAIRRRRLRGGRREGVDLIEVESGLLRFSIVPTRGMGLWRAGWGDFELQWRSPIIDGPIHPALVDLEGRGGLGWLEGFDEFLARCGLENNGAPFVEGDRVYPLHGRIANLPAHHVEVMIDDEPPHAVTITGRVLEARLFFLNVELIASVIHVPGTAALTVRDEVVNLRPVPAPIYSLYHWNFGPPLLDDGSELLAPVETVTPRDARAAEGLDGWNRYGAAEPGFAEQVYFLDLKADADRRTLAVLRGPQGRRAAALRFSKAELPYFTLWKSLMGVEEGYVTGLEPGINLPNPRPVEQAAGRGVTLPPHGRHVCATTLEIADQPDTVDRLVAEVEQLSRDGHA